MNRFLIALAVILCASPLAGLYLSQRADPGRAPAGSIRPPVDFDAPGGVRAAPALMQPVQPEFRMPEEDSAYARAARLAWAYVNGQTQPRTGLVNSVIGYSYGTIWDIASSLAALYCAHELGLVDDVTYQQRMRRALQTLRGMRMYRQAVFNKNYQVATGVPAGRNDREAPPRTDGYGWSAIDVGRLLVWLKIIATSQPEHAADAEAVARRMELQRIVQDGYLWGESLDRAGKPRRYQEGRLGYEQYAAAGYALWGHYADLALDMRQNAQQVQVSGVPILADQRGDGQLTGEPFFLMGLELGWWEPAWQTQARNVLEAQRRRWERTQLLTMISEDALPIPPYYFYYYTLWEDGREFVVTAQGPRVPRPEPRWVSTKAAFAWYALEPGEYTWKALSAVAERAAHPRLGWSSGIYERTGAATGSQNVNTAAVVLEAALYQRRRRPLLAEGLPLPGAYRLEPVPTQ